jgi:hypothetical protein
MEPPPGAVGSTPRHRLCKRWRCDEEREPDDFTLRPVGEPEMGAPGLLTTDPGVYWVWAPIDFGDVCMQFRSFEDRDARGPGG